MWTLPRRRNFALVWTGGLISLAGLGEGVLSTLFVPFIRTVLDAGDLTYGAILFAQAVGGLLGGVVVAHTGRTMRPAWLWGGGALGLALVDLVIFTAPLMVPAVGLTVLLMVVVGMPVAALRVGLATVRQTAVADAYRGRLMGAFLTTNAMTMALGTVTAGVFGERVALVPLMMVQAGSYGLAGMLVLILLRAMHPMAEDGADRSPHGYGHEQGILPTASSAPASEGRR